MGALIPSRLRTWRKKRGFDAQGDLADKINELNPEMNTTQQLVSLWENGISDPSLETITLIARALDVSIDYLVGAVDDPGQRLVTELVITPAKERLLWLIDKGDVLEAVEAVTTIIKGGNESDVASK